MKIGQDAVDAQNRLRALLREMPSKAVSWEIIGEQKTQTGQLVSRPAAPAVTYSAEQLRTLGAVLQRSPEVGRAPSETEIALFRAVSANLGLDYFAGEIGLAKWSNHPQALLQPYVTWAGWLTLAARSHRLTSIERRWADRDGVWREVWLEDHPPAAAKVSIWLEGVRRPISAVATWASWAKVRQNGEPMGNWRTMGDHMLSVAALRLAAKDVIRLTGVDLLPAGIHTETEPELEPEEPEVAEEPTPVSLDGGIPHLRRWAWAMVRHLGLTDEQRHALSGGESWADLDEEGWPPVIQQLRAMTLEHVHRRQPAESVEPVQPDEPDEPDEPASGTSANQQVVNTQDRVRSSDVHGDGLWPPEPGPAEDRRPWPPVPSACEAVDPAGLGRRCINPRTHLRAHVWPDVPDAKRHTPVTAPAPTPIKVELARPPAYPDRCQAIGSEGRWCVRRDAHDGEGSHIWGKARVPQPLEDR